MDLPRGLRRLKEGFEGFGGLWGPTGRDLLEVAMVGPGLIQFCWLKLEPEAIGPFADLGLEDCIGGWSKSKAEFGRDAIGCIIGAGGGVA